MSSKARSSKSGKDGKKITQKYATEWLAGSITVPKIEIGYWTAVNHKKRRLLQEVPDEEEDKKKTTIELIEPGKETDGTYKIDLRNLTGTYTSDETTWRVLGMLPGSYKPYRKLPSNGKEEPKTTDGLPPIMNLPLTVEFSVLQLPQKIQVGNKKVKETLTNSKNEHILRVCFSLNETVRGQFRQEREIHKILRKKYGYNKRFYDRFPRILAEGELARLKGRFPYEERVSSEDRHWIYQPAVPKLFYVMEKIGPSLEEFRQNQRINETLSPHCSVFVIIGCITTLRLVHEAGIAVCDVRPSHFALRMGPTGALHRREADAIGAVVLTHFSRARAYRNLPHVKQTSWAGSRKYISPAVMHHEPPGPVDDVLSCIYMLYEFMTGELPWTPKKDGVVTVPKDKDIVSAKKKLETLDDVEDRGEHGGKDGKKPAALYLHLNKVFESIRKANGYDVPIDYDELNRLLLIGVGHREDIDRGRSTFSFHHPSMFTYRHGCEQKEGRSNIFPLEATTGETDIIRQKANWLFSYARDKRREEQAAEDSKPFKSRKVKK